ncbi:hypothetical protein [Baia soyae]|uniref:Uncharacterized protein n=1 Tax=Baia soyae TaxID=1544746 RepID=A0A4V2SXE8_9BACL|nr:hypothetical protein [Baia soyae]TCP65796.1 hypothetical protein EDD57_13035 [Baia soyae]
MQEDQRADVTYQIGKTTIHVVPPKITEEERNIRIEELKKLILSLWLSIDHDHLYDQEIVGIPIEEQ